MIFSSTESLAAGNVLSAYVALYFLTNVSFVSPCTGFRCKVIMPESPILNNDCSRISCWPERKQ